MARQRRSNPAPETPDAPKTPDVPEITEAPKKEEAFDVIVKKTYSCEINGRVFNVEAGDKITVNEYELGRLRKVEVV